MKSKAKILNLGLPKGSLQESTLKLFRKAGYHISVSGRSYYPVFEDREIESMLIRAQEMARYVENGILECGLTGYDWIMEQAADVHEVAELNYAKEGLRPVKWVIAIPNDSKIKKQSKTSMAKGLRRSWLDLPGDISESKNIKAEIDFSWGATPAFFIGFWPLEWLRAIQAYGHNPFATWPPELLGSFWLKTLLLIGMGLWLGYYAILAWKRPSPFHHSLLVSATILFGLIVLPQTGSYILTLVLAPALILWHYARPARLKGVITASLLLPWLYFMLGGHFDTLIFLLIPGQFIIFQELVRFFYLRA